MLENLASLYHELIIEHSRNPKHQGVIESQIAKKSLGINASCGDKLLLSIEIEDDVLINIKHESSGCAIFLASCSLMSDLLIGKKRAEAQQILSIYMQLITFDEDGKMSPEEMVLLKKLQIFENIANYPARVKCASLFTRTLQNLIKNYDIGENSEVTSTELLI